MKEVETEIHFSLEEIQQLFYRKKKQILKVGVLSALLTCIFLFLSGPKFFIQATFYEGGSSGLSPSLKSLLSATYSLSSKEAEASVLMKSREVLYPLIEKIGAQAQVVQHSSVGRALNRISDNWQVTMNGSLPDKEEFVFQNIGLEKERGQTFYLKFSDPSSFTLLDAQKKELGQGKIGEPLTLSEISFTLQKVPHQLKLKKEYPLHIAPKLVVYNQLCEAIEIQAAKNNSKLLEISIFHRDRHQGSRIVNELMDAYKRYLVKENEKMTTSQMEFLEKRQLGIQKQWQEGLKTYSEHLKQRMHDLGFHSTKEELKNHLKIYQSYLGKWEEIEWKERCIQMQSYAPTLLGGLWDPEIKKISAEILELTKERDNLELFLRLRKKSIGPEQEKVFPLYQEELSSLEETIQRLEHNLHLEELEEAKYPNLGAISLWIKHIHQTKEEKEKKHLKQEFTSYLGGVIRLLEVEKSLIQQRMVRTYSIPEKWEAMDIKMAKELYQGYQAQIDKTQMRLQKLDFTSEKLKDPTYEVGGLVSFLEDSQIKQMIDQIMQLSLKLKEEDQLIEKEKLRMQKEIELKRCVLVHHLGQVRQMEQMNLAWLEEKQIGIQQVILDGIQQKLSLLQKQAQEYTNQQQEILQREKQTLSVKLQEIRDAMQHIPEQWEQEELFKLQNELGIKMAEALTQMVESKTLSHNLYQIQSTPLDYALPPLKPYPKPLFLLSMSMGVLGSLGAFLSLFFWKLWQGFPPSEKTLSYLGQKFLGNLSSSTEESGLEFLPDNDLETLRKIAFFLEEASPSVVSLLHPYGANYSFPLAKLLVQRGYKTLVVNCDFHTPYLKKEEKGLLSYLQEKRKDLPLQKQEGFDYLSSGGCTRFSVEILASPSFQKFLYDRKSQYNLILLYSRSSLLDIESQMFLRFSDKVLVTLEEENIETLQPFIQWSYDKGKLRLAFMRASL